MRPEFKAGLWKIARFGVKAAVVLALAYLVQVAFAFFVFMGLENAQWG